MCPALRRMAPSTEIESASARRQRACLTRCIRGRSLLAQSRTGTNSCRKRVLGIRRDEEKSTSGQIRTDTVLDLNQVPPTELGYARMTLLQCHRLDSNQHVLADTPPSTVRVYRVFHHGGVGGVVRVTGLEPARTSTQSSCTTFVRHPGGKARDRTEFSGSSDQRYDHTSSLPLASPRGIEPTFSGLRNRCPCHVDDGDIDWCALRGTIPHLSIESRGSRPLDEGRIELVSRIELQPSALRKRRSTLELHQRTESRRRDSNPRPPIYKKGIAPCASAYNFRNIFFKS